jgi:hypothetical protein
VVPGVADVELALDQEENLGPCRRRTRASAYLFAPSSRESIYIHGGVTQARGRFRKMRLRRLRRPFISEGSELKLIGGCAKLKTQNGLR